MSSSTNEQRAAAGKGARIVCVIMLIAVFIGGLGFVYKLIQFTHEAMGEAAAEEASFAIVPVIVYACVACGFVFLFLWAVARGQFRDVEGPKFRLLEREASYGD